MVDIFTCKFYHSKVVHSEPATLQRCTDTWLVFLTQTDGKIRSEISTFTSQIPEANQLTERQEVALQKQVHMATDM